MNSVAFRGTTGAFSCGVFTIQHVVKRLFFFFPILRQDPHKVGEIAQNLITELHVG